MELFLDALLDALIDGVKMLPFLYLAYLLIEWLERHHGESIEGALAGGGRWGFIPGALLGCVPQCGFSAVASNLYASRIISAGDPGRSASRDLSGSLAKDSALCGAFSR